jgi:ribosomal protein S18 acetylase RimI-like enzyme
MTLTVNQVVSPRQMREFIHLPAKIHKHHKNWVPPIYIDERVYFDNKKNRAFDHCDTIMYIAQRDGLTVGRIMGIISHDYNNTKGVLDARFAYFETYDEPEVFNLLLDSIAEWAKNLGMNRLVGPLGFSDKDPQGWLIDGYDEPVVIASNCNFKYMNRLIEQAGFEKEVDLVVYRIPVPTEMPALHRAVYNRFITTQRTLKVREFSRRSQVKPYIQNVLSLVNRTFTSIYGFVPFTVKEMDDFANRYLYLIRPSFIKIVTDTGDNVVAFVIAMSDISKGIQKSKGYLFPVGILHILFAGRRGKQLNLLLGAIDPEFQGRGLDVVLAYALIESAKKAGKTVIDSHLELEYNYKVRAEMERMGGEVYKRYRIYGKEIVIQSNERLN